MRLRRLLLLLACLSVLALNGCFHETEKVTVYNYHCDESGWGTLRTQSYAVYPQRQEVVSDNLFRLEHCAIYDKYNWSCRYSDGSGTVTIRNGSEVTNYREEYAKYKTVTVPAGRITYWLSFVLKNETLGQGCRAMLEVAKSQVKTQKPGG
jgi:hypothetical protein